MDNRQAGEHIMSHKKAAYWLIICQTMRYLITPPENGGFYASVFSAFIYYKRGMLFGAYPHKMSPREFSNIESQ